MSIHETIDWLVQWVEAAGAGLVVAGIVVAAFRVVRVPFMRSRPPLAALQIRLGLGMFLALGLEFLLAADILRTAVAPTFRDVALLASIAAIRTALNYFLSREFVEGQHQIDALGSGVALDARTVGPPCGPALKRARAPRPVPDPPSPRRRSARAALRDAIKGPLWIPELPGTKGPAEESRDERIESS